MQSKPYAYVNGRFVPEAEATVSIFDRGFLYGDGVFETMRIYGGRIFRLEHHLGRLSTGLHKLGIESPRPEVADLLRQLIKRNRVSDGIARIYVTRGSCGPRLSTKELKQPSVVALAMLKKFEAETPALRVIVSTVRLREHSPFEGLKTANRLEYVMAKVEAERAGVDDAVLLNEDGWVVELSASNLFAVMGGKLFTSSIGEGGLQGITRSAVIEIAGALEIAVEEAGFEPAFLEQADEIFATNSVIEIAPVGEINGRRIPSQSIIQRLHVAYRELVQRELKAI